MRKKTLLELISHRDGAATRYYSEVPGGERRYMAFFACMPGETAYECGGYCVLGPDLEGGTWLLPAAIMA